MTPLSWNSSQRSLPSRVRSPTPPNTDTPPCFRAMLWISSMMTTVLPTPAPPNRPILPPCRYGSSRSMTLMPVSNIFSSVDCCLERRRGAVNRPALLRLHRTVRKVDRLAEHVQHAAERLGADRHRDRLAEIDRLHAALHAVGRLHRDRAHAVLAEVLLDFGDDVERLAARLRRRDDAQRVVDCRQVSGLELDVDDRPDDLDDFADVLLHVAVCALRSRHAV